MKVAKHSWFSILAGAALILIASLVLVNCRGGGGDDAPTTTPTTPTVTTFSVGGTVSGLSGSGLVLQNNSGDDQVVSGNGGFTFATMVATSGAYNVTIRTQPTTPDQVCEVGNGSGTVVGANITNITITCSRYVPRFAYAANYGDNTVSIYVVNPVTGQLRHNGYALAGTNPSSISIDPAGKFAYVANSGGGVSAYTINADNGALTQIDAMPGLVGIQNYPADNNPIAVSVDPSGKFVYVANFGSNSVSAYTINAATGAITALIDVDAGTPGNQSSIATGANPQYITIDPFGKFVYVANYTSNNVSAYRISAVSGALTSVGTVTVGNNPYAVTVDPFGKFAYVANNSSNNVSAFRINAASGALTSAGTVTAGTGPRSVTVEPTGRFAYVANTLSNDVSAFSIDSSTGALTPLVDVNAGSWGIQQSIPAGTNPYSVIVDPSGKFVYVANSGSHNISAYSIDSATGGLTTLMPTVKGRNGNIAMAMSKGTTAVTYTPKFAYVANRGSNNISAYSIDAVTGALTSVGTTSAVAGRTYPTSVSVDPFGRFAYVVNGASDNISAYSINAATGALTHVSTSATGSFPETIAIDPSGRFAYVTNGSANNVLAYAINSVTGALTSIGTVTADNDPRFGPVDPSGKFAYVANQSYSKVSAYSISATTGALTEVAGSPFDAGTYIRFVSVDPSGRFAYVLNPSLVEDISAYTIDAGTGALTPIICGGSCSGSNFLTGSGPESISFDPAGKFAYVANYFSNNIWVYSINAWGGDLQPVDIITAGTNPHSISVDPSGKFAYVANYGSNNVSVYAIDSTTGALTSRGTVSAGYQPYFITIIGTIQ